MFMVQDSIYGNVVLYILYFMSVKALKTKKNVFILVSLLCISPMQISSKSQIGRGKSSVEHRL